MRLRIVFIEFLQIAISLVGCQRRGWQVLINFEHLLTINLFVHSAPRIRGVFFPPFFWLRLVKNIRNNVVADDTARYLNALKHMFWFILSELNLTKGNLQFGYLPSLEQFDIQLTNLGIIAGAQRFYGRVWSILRCKVFITNRERLFVIYAFSRSMNYWVIYLFRIDMLHTSLTQKLLWTLRCCNYIGQVGLNHQIIVEIYIASGFSRRLLGGMHMFINHYRLHHLSEINSSWPMFNELLPILRSFVHLNLLRS